MFSCEFRSWIVFLIVEILLKYFFHPAFYTLSKEIFLYFLPLRILSLCIVAFQVLSFANSFLIPLAESEGEQRDGNNEGTP